jgi:hypothetical protein
LVPRRELCQDGRLLEGLRLRPAPRRLLRERREEERGSGARVVARARVEVDVQVGLLDRIRAPVAVPLVPDRRPAAVALREESLRHRAVERSLDGEVEPDHVEVDRDLP